MIYFPLQLRSLNGKEVTIFRQHAASIYGFVRLSVCQSKKICVSVRWDTLWVRPPPLKICVSVRWITLWVRPPPQ